METLGILHTKKIGKPKPTAIAALWQFDGGTPHIMTDVEITAPATGDRVRVSALWDTGASICAISKEVAYEIGLKPTGKTECEVAGGKSIEAETAKISFTLPDGTTTEAETSIIEMPSRAYDLIVGMNVILQGDFLIRKTQGGFEFLFKIATH